MSQRRGERRFRGRSVFWALATLTAIAIIINHWLFGWMVLVDVCTFVGYHA